MANWIMSIQLAMQEHISNASAFKPILILNRIKLNRIENELD